MTYVIDNAVRMIYSDWEDEMKKKAEQRNRNKGPRVPLR